MGEIEQQKSWVFIYYSQPQVGCFVLVLLTLIVSCSRCMAIQLDRIEDILGLKWKRVEVMTVSCVDRIELDEMKGSMD